MSKSPSLAEVRLMLRETAPDITIRKEDCGEYRVTFTQAAIAAAFPEMTRAELIAKAESLASYDSDIASAYEAGKSMYRIGLSPAPLQSEAAPVTADIRTVRTFDATPTWRAILPILFAALENGTDEGRRIARAEMSRMADAADKWNASQTV